MTILDRPPAAPARAGGGVGTSARRPDGPPKVQGAFAYASDLRRDGMLFGATTRSPHPHARIRGIDTSAAEALEGVRCVLTHADVPGRPTFGLVLADQPVLASDRVRFHGEAVAVVAADDLATARAAARLVRVDYEPLPVLSDPELALDPGSAPALHPGGNVLRHLTVVHGDVDAHAHEAEVVVRGEYAVGTQDQAPLGPEGGLAVPRPDGGVDLHLATQWLHADRDQVAACLALEPGQVRLVAAGAGGAFGAREDLTMQVHACLLALRTGRPVQVPYTRQESFLAHVHRHPARMAYEHGATRDGRLVYVRARLLMDGGAYASTSIPVIMVAASFLGGPYVVPHATFDARVVFTNNPPSGAMRGFGAVQVCFGHEAQMDRLAAAVGLSALEVRRRNAIATGGRLPTGQAIHGPAPVRELLDHLGGLPAPPLPEEGLPDGVARGTGYAVGIKNMGFSEGFDDNSTARVALWTDPDGEPAASVRTAACEVGQGVVTVQAQIARTELGVQRVAVLEADTDIGNAGASSASRHTFITGGAVHAACVAVAARVCDLAAERLERPPAELALAPGGVADRGTGELLVALGELLGDEVVEEERTFRPRRTVPLDERGQGDCHATFTFAAHRVVADVDVELGTVRLVQVATAQDVGRAVNPQAVEGQMEGGTVQGLGLALMEDLRSDGGVVLNGSLADYLIPTALDVPPIDTHVLELAQPGAPYGVNGIGEAPTVSAGAAVLAALRDATGREVPRAPASLDDLAGT